LKIQMIYPQIHRLVWLVCLGALSAASGAMAQTSKPSTSPANIPVVDFFKQPALQAPSLSPSGKKIAVIIGTNSGRKGLAVADIATPTKFLGVAQFEDADIRSFAWVNDNRLVFDAVDFQAGLGEQLGSGLYAVNADGTDFLWLIERTGNYRVMGNPSKRPLPNRHRLFAVLDDGTDDVVVQRYNFLDNQRVPGSTLLKLNTKTLELKTMISSVPEAAQSWVLDRNGVPRALLASDGKSGIKVQMRTGNSNEWTTISQSDQFDSSAASFEPFAFDYDDQLWVKARLNNPEKTTALFRYDTKTNAIESKPLFSLKGFDFEGSLIFDGKSRKVMGINYTSDAPGTVWFDESLKRIQEEIDKQLPNTINEISCKRCASAQHFVVRVSSDRQSPMFFLADRSTLKLQLIGAERPWLDSALTAEVDFVRIPSRDGMEIPTYITKPKGKGPFPTVVLIHGGPHVRGSVWGFNSETQFLASRGYLVVEPEFRGSLGYGETWFRAGWRQWGLKMQDDMTDAAKWAVSKGLADANRVAIAGGSYGGYAAMMGLVKEPSLFKAGLNFVGVTDIELLYTIGWSDTAGSTWERFGMPKLIGDRDKDIEQFRKTSPLLLAPQIKQPVFMAYGEDDLRVPLPHGTKLRDALIKSGNTQVEWNQYANEGHGFLLEKNKVDFYSRMEKFLAKHLK
jgi:dipeptidyl aminopeptidase/acylaminoacyl peptidase